MKLRYLRAFIVLLAGLIALIVNMRIRRDVTISLLIVLIVILVFYIIGTLVVELLQQGLENDSEEPKKADNVEEVNVETFEAEEGTEAKAAFAFDEEDSDE